MHIKQLTHLGTVYTQPRQIAQVLTQTGFGWVTKATTNNAVIELHPTGLVWRSGEWLAGNWVCGTWLGGSFGQA